jgi:hypothetical protein
MPASALRQHIVHIRQHIVRHDDTHPAALNPPAVRASAYFLQKRLLRDFTGVGREYIDLQLNAVRAKRLPRKHSCYQGKEYLPQGRFLSTATALN